MDQREFRDKIALVTGAGSGLGEATACLLARLGAEVGLLGRTEAELDQTRDSIARLGGRSHVLVADISDAEATRSAIDRFASQVGAIHVLFANAGVNGVWAPLEDLSVAEWQRTLSINLSGTFYTIKASVPHMRAQGGSIVVCSSVNGTRMFSNTGATAYAVSKAGQVVLTKMLAVELARYGVRVNVICPGAFETEIDDNTQQRNLEHARPPVEYPEGAIPLTHGEPGRAEQVAQLVAFLSSSWASHITGTEVWIDGGQSLLQG
ncbi:MAG: SDR family oxidoreductase [Myxococcales bacterium]|jgi:NAD(P)-dependent dehydrogenase (short-subunit alcohol dehydrogenase family)|nr:SDR family oxidoreductase [Myxococcales bacterium]